MARADPRPSRLRKALFAAATWTGVYYAASCATEALFNAGKRCTDALADGEACLERGDADAALSAFTEALKATEGLVFSAVSLLSDTPAMLRWQAHLGLARTYLLKSQPERALAEATQALDCVGACAGTRPEAHRLAAYAVHDALVAASVKCCAERDWLTAFAFAERATESTPPGDESRSRAALKAWQAAMLLKVKTCLAEAEEDLLQKRWQAAEAKATAALQDCRTIPGGPELQAHRIIDDARFGRFTQLVESSEQMAQARLWKEARRMALEAQSLAVNALAQLRVKSVLHAVDHGVFEASLNSVVLMQQQRDFEGAVRAARQLVRDAPGGNDYHVRAAAALQTACGLACNAQLDKAAAAIERREWYNALAAVNAAAANAAGPQQGRVAELRAAAYAGEFEAAMERATSALQARNWSGASSTASSAFTFAASQQQREQADGVLRSAQAGVKEERRREEERRAEEERRRRAQLASALAEADYVVELDAYIRGHRDFTGHDPTGFRCKLTQVAANCAPPATILGSLVEIIERNPGTFTLHQVPKPAVSVTRLTPFRGEEGHRVWGDFRCSAVRANGRTCGHRWGSGKTYCDNYQQCQQCETEIYPYAQHALEQREDAGVDEDRAPHDTSRCERCQRLGRNCDPRGASTDRYAAQARGGGRGRGRGRGDNY